MLYFCHLLACPDLLSVVRLGWAVNVTGICGKKDISLVHFKRQMMALNQVLFTREPIYYQDPESKSK